VGRERSNEEIQGGAGGAQVDVTMRNRDDGGVCGVVCVCVSVCLCVCVYVTEGWLNSSGLTTPNTKHLTRPHIPQPHIPANSGPPNCPTRDAGRGLLGAALRFLKEKERALKQQLASQEKQREQERGGGGRGELDTGGEGGGVMGLAARALASAWGVRW
jgi:hypothetical protein